MSVKIKVNEEDKDKVLEEEILYSISKFFYQYRKDNNLTQKELASSVGVNQSTISKIEGGKLRPNLMELYKILYNLSDSNDMFFYLLDKIKADMIKVSNK